MKNTRERERGVALAAVGMWLGALLALTVVAVDVGRLATTATEVQTAADAAAIAGAIALGDSRNSNHADPAKAAINVGAMNTSDGEPTAIAHSDVTIGNWTDGVFTPGGDPANAVRAWPSTTVDNVVAGVFGDHTTKVEKAAIAAYSGVTTGNPVLPIVVGECKFAQFQSTGNCSSLPGLTQAPDPNDNSGWTSLSTHPASASEALKFLPLECGGRGEEPPVVHIGDQVNVLNGVAVSITHAVQTCLSLGKHTFQIPIVPCGTRAKFSTSMQVVGFATIEIKRVRGGNGGMDLDAICKLEKGQIGGPATDFGTRHVSLVR